MSDYRVADGADVVLGSLTVLNPQPMTTGIQPSRRTFAANGDVYDEAKFVEFVYSMVPDVTTYQAILTAFGVNAALTNVVTVYVRTETFAYARYNGTAVRPEMGRDVKWSQYFPRDVIILVKDLTASA